MREFTASLEVEDGRVVEGALEAGSVLVAGVDFGTVGRAVVGDASGGRCGASEEGERESDESLLRIGQSRILLLS